MAEADWELSKENVQPLKQGRDVNTLKDVLAQHEALSHISIQEQKQAFETEIRFYSGNDPLDVWDRYIKWTEQTFPHGGTDSNHLALLERALKLFLKDDRYYSDLRYLGHWLKFVDYCTDPLEMFDFLNSKGIGVSHAALYVAWAERFELLGNTKKAEAILQEGIRLNAEPVEKLQHNLRHFQSRVFKQVVASIAEGTNENSTLEPTQQRTSLGDLKRRGQKRAMAPVKRVGSGVQSLNQGLGHYVAPAQEQCGTFEVFNENRMGTQLVEELKSTEKQWSTLPSTSAKENEIVPGPWNTSGMRVPRRSSVHAIPFSTVLSAKKPDFKLYEEESSHEETMTPRKIEPLFTPVLSARKPSKELNPLTRVQVQNCNENKEVSMYSKDQIYAGLREFSFEELRAEEFKKKYKARMKEQEEKLLKLKQEKEEVEQLIHMAELRMKEQREHSQPETQQNEAIHDPLPCSAITTREFGTDINLSERNGEDSDRNGLNEIASRLKNANLSDCTDTINHMSSDLVTCSQMSDKNPFDYLDSGSRDCNKEDLEYEAQFMKCADNSHLSSVSSLMPPFLGLPPASAAFNIFDETAEAEIQNKPPASYLKLNTQWRRSGILVPSQHVLAEGICSAACDDLDGIEPLNEDHFVSSDYPNKTLGPYPENTCDFSRGAHLVSTPFHRNTLTDDQENSIKKNCIDGSKNALSSLSPIKESLFDQPLHAKKLSPIQEASEDGLSSAATTSSSAVSSSSVGGLGTMSDLNVLEKLELGHLNSCETNSMNSTSDNPWDLEIRKQLLSSLLVPLSSFPEFHVENGPVPTFEDGLELTLGLQTFNIKLAAVHEQYRVFYGTNPRLSLSRAIIKVHSHTVPWDFYINQQLKMRLGSKFNNYFSQNHSCYLFENGCVTVDRGKNCETLQGLSQMWETVPEALVVFLTLDLLALVELMHTAEIVHGGIAPETLVMDDRFYEGSACPSGDGLVKLTDFAHSLDLKLQSGVVTFMKFPTMQSLSNKELLFGCTNAYQVDLLGIANTVHFLLFGGEIDVSKQGSLWTLGPTSSRMELLYLELWNNFFEKILNTGGASSVSTLSDLRQTVTEVIEPDYEILYNDAFTLMPHD
ncbi:mitotic checkpoint serine/threonine-protein kinase BUB1 beta [Chiloscyllium punctatum]|uniref:mitotic checkpoint serine/threonine-protein kinase BUB1 beta n=1 Tax=Chiloscyllium punctatum TaxID=137246 RepID=UPI003B63FB9E